MILKSEYLCSPRPPNAPKSSTEPKAPSECLSAESVSHLAPHLTLFCCYEFINSLAASVSLLLCLSDSFFSSEATP